MRDPLKTVLHRALRRELLADHDLFLREMLEVYDRGDIDKIAWFFDRMIMEIDGHKLHQPGRIVAHPIVRTTSDILQKLYLSLHLDKVFPTHQAIALSKIEICHPKIDPAFDGFKILWLSDLHLNAGHPEKTIEKLCKTVLGTKPELMVYGGDYRHGHKFYLGDFEKWIFNFLGLVTAAASPKHTVALLGNHDIAEMVPLFPHMGAQPLINDHIDIKKDEQTLRIIGIDDSYRFFQDLALLTLAKGISPDTFNVVLSHSPHIADAASERGADLFLCGHTHGGQFKSRFIQYFQKRFFQFEEERNHGRWKSGHMEGYTSSGTGASAIPIRNIESEVVLFTLRAGPR